MDVHLIPPAFERIFQSPKWLGGEKVKHVIEPRIDYKLVDGIDNFNNIIRFDENDLMNDTDQVTLSLTNRLLVKDKNGNVNEVMSWEVAQSRYFDPTFGGAVIPGQRNVIESTEDLDGFDFLDGPRNYSPIVSVLRFQHVVGFEWRLDYDPLLGRISNSSFNGNIRLSKYFFSLGPYRSAAKPGGNRAQQSDQRSGGGGQSKPQGLECRGQCLLRPGPGHPGFRHYRDHL